MKTLVLTGTADRYWGWLFELLGVPCVRQSKPTDEILRRIEEFTQRDHSAYYLGQIELARMCGEQISDRALSYPGFRDLDPKELRVAVQQRLLGRFSTSIFFARVCRRILGEGQIKILIAAPSPVRAFLESSGLCVSQGLSRLSWMISVVESLGQIPGEHAKAMARVVRDYFKLRGAKADEGELPDAFFLGLSHYDFGDPETGLNIFSYLKERRLPFLNKAKRIFVAHDGARKTAEIKAENVVEGRDLFMCPGRRAMTVRELIVAIWAQLALAFGSIKRHKFGGWYDVLLTREMAQLPRARAWFKSVRPAVIVWPNSGGGDPIWAFLRKKYACENWLVAYSTNTGDLENKGEATGVANPYHSFLTADRFAVWNEEQRHWLRSLGYPEDKITAVGAVVFCKFPVRAAKGDSVIRISLFDVIPSDNRVVLPKGRVANYLSLKNMCAFVDDTFKAAEQVLGPGKFEILVKPKRRAPHDDAKYWEFLSKAFSNSAAVRVLEPETSPVKIIAESDAVISIPFTSTSWIGMEYGIPSCFYDPTGKIASTFITKNHPPLVNGFSELQNWLKRSLESAG